MNSTPAEPSFLRRLFSVVLRLAIVLVVGIALGAGAYLGVPEAYRRIVEPAQVNTTRIDAIQSELELARSDTSDLRDQTGERLAELEAALTEQGEALASALVQLEAARSNSLDQDRTLRALGDEVEAMLDTLATLSEEMGTSLAELGDPKAELQQELRINRAMLHLVRARLWLVENNVGSAGEEAERALALLEEADPEHERDDVQAAIGRIELALEELRTTPLVAGDDLEIAWKLLGAADDESPLD